MIEQRFYNKTTECQGFRKNVNRGEAEGAEGNEELEPQMAQKNTDNRGGGDFNADLGGGSRMNTDKTGYTENTEDTDFTEGK